MELRHLQAFVAVAEEMHFGRAAARLQLSPSPVSRSVLELERELAVPLFTRTHHRVRLTDAGASLLPSARELLDGWSAFTAHGRSLGRGATMPRVRIGSPSLASTTVIDLVVDVLTELYPDVPVEVEFASSMQLLTALRQGELDLTVVNLPLDEPGVRVMPLARHRLSVVMRSSDQLAERDEVAPEDLAGKHLLHLDSALQPATGERVRRWLSGLGAVQEDLPDTDLARLAQLVQRGRGLALTGRKGPAAQLFTLPGLTVVPLQEPGPTLELGLVWRADEDDSRLVQELRPRLARMVQDGLLDG